MGETTTRPLVTTWGWVLGSLAELSRSDMVCSRQGPEHDSDPCLVVDSDTMEPEEDIPFSALERGFTECLLTDQIVDVLENLSLQGVRPDPPIAYEAIRYYFEYDAFLNVRTVSQE